MKKSTSVFRSKMNSMLCVALICCSCSAQTSQTQSVQSDSLIKSQPPRTEEFAYLRAIMKDLTTLQNDSDVEIIRITKSNFSDHSFSEPLESLFTCEDLVCTTVKFKNLTGKPPYNIYFRRTAQDDPSAFLPRPLEQGILNSQCSEKDHRPPSLALSPQGILPGERVTWRLSESDGTIVKEVTICPRPMVLKNKSGKIILEAAFLTPSSYFIRIPELDEPVIFVSNSETETIKHPLPLREPIMMNLMPAVIGKKGGFSQIELQFLNDGSSYKMQIPWGSALVDYLTGKK